MSPNFTCSKSCVKTVPAETKRQCDEFIWPDFDGAMEISHKELLYMYESLWILRISLRMLPSFMFNCYSHVRWAKTSNQWMHLYKETVKWQYKRNNNSIDLLWHGLSSPSCILLGVSLILYPYFLRHRYSFENQLRIISPFSLSSSTQSSWAVG